MAADDAPQAKGLQHEIVREVYRRFGETGFVFQSTVDGMPTLWVEAGRILDVLRFLKNEVARPYRMLFDLTALDERVRKNRDGQPASALIPALPYACRVAATKMTGSFCASPTRPGPTRSSPAMQISSRLPPNRGCGSSLRLRCTRSRSRGLAASKIRAPATG